MKKDDSLQINPEKIESPTLRRLIEEVRLEGRTEAAGYNRMHNRHNRSSYHRTYLPGNYDQPSSRWPLRTGKCDEGGNHEPFEFRNWRSFPICKKCDKALR
jgi:hypothetical protein